MTKPVFIDADVLVYKAANVLQPSYYYVGESYFKTKKEAQAYKEEKAMAEEEITKVDFLCPPDQVPLIASRVLTGFINRLKEDVKGTVWEEGEFYWMLNGESNFRKDHCSHYKSKRRDKPFYYRQVKDWLMHKLDAIQVEPFESDDTTALFLEASRGQGLLSHCDKDLLNIPGAHHDFLKNVIFEISPEEGFYHLIHQILTGDTTDDIIGFPGIGPKKADKILGAIEFSQDVYTHLSEDWEKFRAGCIAYFGESLEEEEVIKTIDHTLPLVDVGGYWSRRLSQQELLQTVVDYRPILVEYQNQVL